MAVAHVRLLEEFQSTRPRGARHAEIAVFTVEDDVSIHAPAWGATKDRMGLVEESLFQSTRPRGARPWWKNVACPNRLFQSTRPRGARLERLFPALFHAGFNPRARVGRDKSISLTVRIFLCFNPRARVGRDAR